MKNNLKNSSSSSFEKGWRECDKSLSRDFKIVTYILIGILLAMAISFGFLIRNIHQHYDIKQQEIIDSCNIVHYVDIINYEDVIVRKDLEIQKLKK